MKVRGGLSENWFPFVYGTHVHFCDPLYVNEFDSDTYNPKRFQNLHETELQIPYSCAKKNENKKNTNSTIT